MSDHQNDAQQQIDELEQREAAMNAKTVVVTHETLICAHNPTTPLHLRDEKAVYLLLEYMREGGERITQITLEEARTWLNEHGQNPHDFSNLPGATIRDWHPA